jgi:mono/diheme cytochrome c family protein
VNRKPIARFVAVLALAACAGCSRPAAETATAASPTPDPGRANGQAIFQTGRDADGKPISARPPALRPSCAACHLASGAGGVKLPGGATSADLRPSALVAGQKHPYTLALLERAISTGIDNEGQRLNPVMPRWQLSQRDLRDVAGYLLTLT